MVVYNLGSTVCHKLQMEGYFIINEATLIQKNRENMQKVTNTVLKQSYLCIANAGGHLEQEVAKDVCYVTAHIKHK